MNLCFSNPQGGLFLQNIVQVNETMNLLALKNINLDLKSIDLASLKRTLIQRQDIAANLALMLFSLFLVFQIYSNRHNEAAILQARVSDLDKKIEAILQHEKATKELDEFLKVLPQGIVPYNIIDQLNDLAEKRKIQIASFLPVQSQSEALYEKNSVRLEVSATHYQDIWSFIYDIETSPYNLRVDRWSGRSELNPQGSRAQSSEEERFYAQIEIAAIYFKK